MTLLQGRRLQPLPLLCGIEVLPQPVPHRDWPDDPRGYDALDPPLAAIFHEHRDFHQFPAPQIDRAHAVHVNRLDAKRIDQAVPKRHNFPFPICELLLGRDRPHGSPSAPLSQYGGGRLSIRQIDLFHTEYSVRAGEIGA